MVLRESIRVTHVQARAYHTPLSTLIPIPPSTRGASLHGISEPHIDTAATSQFPRTRREANWEATTVPPQSLMTLSYVSPQPLHMRDRVFGLAVVCIILVTPLVEVMSLVAPLIKVIQATLDASLPCCHC